MAVFGMFLRRFGEILDVFLQDLLEVLGTCLGGFAGDFERFSDYVRDGF